MRRSDREISDRPGLEEILCRTKTCHIAMIDGDWPYIVPLNYGYRFLDENTLELYFHSAKEGKKLDVIKANSKVGFAISNEGEPVEAELPCNLGYYYFSIIGFGEAIIIEDPEEKCEILSVIVKHQRGMDVVFTPQQAETVCVFKIVSDNFTGKRKQKPAG